MLEIRNIRYAYDDQTEVLKDLNFTVNRGGFLALVGSEGCGKTTLVHLICGKLGTQEGQITLNGVDNSEFSVKNAILSLSREESLPVFLTGLEYINFLLVMYKAKLNEAYLKELAAYFSFDSLLHVMIKDYSYGMKKKIQLIAAMLVKPDILIIDETLNDMDSDLKEMTLIQLEKYADEGNTIIICSQDLKSLDKVCNRAVILYDGTIHLADQRNKEKEKSGLTKTFEERPY